MRTISIFILAVLIVLISCFCGHAQTMTTQAINVSGGSGKKAVFLMDWSAGEMVLTSTMKNSDSTVFLTNGLLQPTQLAGKSTPNNYNALSIDEVTLFPNPVADKLYITVMPKQKGQIRIMLFDQNAGMVFYKVYPVSNGVSETIPMNTYVNGMFTLRVELYPERGAPRKSSFPIMKVNK
ncbi:MAG: hypothetical protein J7578_07765 [Chitinophagaceae bacterium]|nr:hypothetical protein [Chitinophagaceae bacterium]